MRYKGWSPSKLTWAWGQRNLMSPETAGGAQCVQPYRVCTAMHRVGTTVHRMYKTIHRVGTYSSLLVGLQLLVPSEAPQGDITAFVHTHATRKHFWNVPWLGLLLSFLRPPGVQVPLLTSPFSVSSPYKTSEYATDEYMQAHKATRLPGAQRLYIPALMA